MRRERLGKLVGMLGGSGGERVAALDAVDKALAAGSLTWGWLAELVEHGETPGGDRERIFKRLVVDRLRSGLEVAWAMPNGAATRVKDVLALIERGKPIDAADIDQAIDIADKARRMAR